MVDHVKLFLRPNEFLMIAHFFGYGYPEYDEDSEEQPNAHQTDVEKTPA